SFTPQFRTGTSALPRSHSTCVHDPSFTRSIRRVVTRTRLRLAARWPIRSAISTLASHHRELVLTTFSGLGLAGRWSMVGPSFCCRSASPALTMTCGCTGSTDGRLFSFCPLRAACVRASLGDSLRVAISSSQLAPTRSPFTATETRGSRPSSLPVKPQASSLSLRAQRRDSVWFVLTLHPSYERGGNRVFLYDGERLLSLGDYQELVDADVHLVRHRIAFLYWDGGQRHVVRS